MGSDEVDTRFPTAFRAPRWGAGSAWLARIRRRRTSAYGAGPGVDDAIAACRRLAASGVASTIGYTASANAVADDVADVQLGALARLAEEELDCYVSVKLSTLGFDATLLARLEAAAAHSGRRLHLDALGPETADRMWSLLERAGDARAIGVTLPGRWRRSADDAARADALGLPVRIVKGQWVDGADVDPGDGFLRVVDRLRDHAPGVAVATHDGELLAEALRRLTQAGTRCEVELFHGLPFRAPARAARRLGVPVRVYVPYGDVGAPYELGDLRRNPAAAWWLAQDLLLGKDKLWRAVER